MKLTAQLYCFSKNFYFYIYIKYIKKKAQRLNYTSYSFTLICKLREHLGNFTAPGGGCVGVRICN